MPYREFAPPRSLANIIECVWTNSPTVRTKAEPTVIHTILPDGAMDVICTFYPDGEIDETFVVGSMTNPQIATIDDRHFVGVRFLPGAAGSALNINAATLTNEHADIGEITYRETLVRDAFRTLRMNASSAHAVHHFSESLGVNHRDVPPLVRSAAKQLGNNFSSSHVQKVANDLHVSRQHLTRMFAAHSGLTPKLFAQICRVRALLAFVQSQRNLIQHSRATEPLPERATSRSQSPHGLNELRGTLHPDSWSQLSAQFGYVDQSHLIAEVHAIIGQTPAAWYAAQRAALGSNIPIVPVPVAQL